MPTTIKCPNCQHEFPLEEAVSEEYKKDLREQMRAYKQQKDEEIARREREWQQAAQKQQAELRQQVEENLRQSIYTDFENKLRLLERNNRENEEKLREARAQQVEFLRREQELKNREAELELSVQIKLQAEREKLAEDIRRLEEQRIAAKETEFQLRLKEMEEKLEAQRRLAEEMRRKAEQGSMQLQGEVQELALQEILQAAFPFDLVTEVGKGVRGADCIQTVRNALGQECGRIIYESKRTAHFSADWIDKLKADMRSQGADVALLVTQALPRDLERFGQKDGVWICRFEEVQAVAFLLRDGIIRVFQAARSQENKGDKMTLLYNYLTSSEFAEQWKAIREGFMSMKLSIQKERDAMEKLWKAREKQLEKVLLNAAHIRGSIEGISGMDSVDLNLLESGGDAIEE
ncbi:MAG TPA: DUF2130 domain-containing protein [Chitinophagaceae bacterium]|nr:DUF2130 domain-containing protein [Chitinophagaceae bacterium]